MKKSGLTLIELMIVIVMFVILVTVVFYIFRAVLLNWSSQETRAGIDISLDVEIEGMVRDLREATDITSVNDDEIRFTEGGSDYIYYLYNQDDSYPPAFDQSSYDIRKATLTGGISGTFTYGDGQLIAIDILPPTTTDLAISGNLATIDLSISRGDETIRSRTQVRPRNI